MRTNIPEKLLEISDEIAARGHANLTRLTAFRGELVPQDPSDEPALALLERIRDVGKSRLREPR